MNDKSQTGSAAGSAADWSQRLAASERLDYSAGLA